MHIHHDRAHRADLENNFKNIGMEGTGTTSVNNIYYKEMKS